MVFTEQHKYGFAKLGNDNYGTWSVQMKGLLATKECDGAITQATHAKSNMAKGLMIMCVEDQHLQTIESAQDAKEAWEALEALYRQTSTASLLQLRKQLNTLEKRSSENIAQYISRAREIANRIHAATGNQVDDTDMALAVLGGLPSEYDMIRTVITSMDKLPSVANIQAKLLLVEKQLPSSEESAYYSRAAQQRPGADRYNKTRRDDKRNNGPSAKGKSGFTVASQDTSRRTAARGKQMRRQGTTEPPTDQPLRLG